MMADLASVRVVVYGGVQGVFFRAFVCRQATKLALSGYALNLPAGEAVEVLAEGDRGQLEKLIDSLRVGPPAARVEKVVTSWSKYSGNYPGFSIRY